MRYVKGRHSNSKFPNLCDSQTSGGVTEQTQRNVSQAWDSG